MERRCPGKLNGQAARGRGFSLLEVMVTLAVGIIVITLVIPSFSQLLQNNRARNLGFELQSTLNLARSEAINRNRKVTVCARQAEALLCDLSTDGQGDWSNGWLIFLDGNGATEGQYDPDDEELLRLRESLEVGSIRSNQANLKVVFQSNGSATGNRTYRICFTANQDHFVILHHAGRSRHEDIRAPAIDPADKADLPTRVAC